MRRKTWVLFTALIIVSLGLVACGGDDDPAPAATRVTTVASPTPATIPATPAPTGPQGILNIARTNLSTEDWVLRLVAGKDVVLYHMNDTLVALNDESFDPEPQMAESWDIKKRADGQTDWTFNLRKGMTFQQGQGEVTAQDAMESFLSMGKDGTKNGFAVFIWRNWIGEDPTRITAPDKHTIKVTSPAPISTLLQLVLSDYAGASWIFPKKYMDEVGEDGFQDNPVYTGPFEFEEHQRGVQVTLNARTDHWRVVPEFAQLRFHIIPEVATVLANVRANTIDVAEMPLRFKKEIESLGMTTRRALGGGEDFIQFGSMYYVVPRDGFDSTLPWVGDFDQKDPAGGENALKVRQALNHAIDRQAILDVTVAGEGYASTIMGNFQKPGVPWWNPAWHPYEFDPVLAKNLLTEAGYPDGFEVNLWILKGTGAGRGEDQGEAVASMWEQNLGLKVNRLLVSYRPTVRENLVNRTTGGHMWVFNREQVSNPTNAGCRVGGPSNAVVLHFEHPAWDKYCPLLQAATDPVENARLTRELGDIFYRNHFNAPLVNPNILYVIGPKVLDWQPFPRQQNIFRLEYATRAVN